MESYEIFEEENSEWLKGLLSAQDFSCDNYHNSFPYPNSPFMKNSPLRIPSNRNEEENLNKPPDLLDTYSFWEQHSHRASPLPVPTPPPNNRILSRNSSFDNGSAPMMIESYLPTTHGVIKISFPSLSAITSKPRNNDVCQTVSAETNSVPNNHLPANDQIYEMIRNHLSNYYQLEERHKAQFESPTSTSFDNNGLASSSADSYLTSSASTKFLPVITSSTSSVVNLCNSQNPSPNLNPFDSPTQRKEYFSLLYSDTSDDENREHLNVESPPAQDDVMNHIEPLRRKKGRGKKQQLVQPPTETNTDVEEEEEVSDDGDNHNYEGSVSDESDIQEQKTRRKKRKISKLPDSSSLGLPRRKASQFARDILMDWLVEHECKGTSFFSE